MRTPRPVRSDISNDAAEPRFLGLSDRRRVEQEANLSARRAATERSPWRVEVLSPPDGMMFCMVAVHAQQGAEAGRPAAARFAGLFPHRLLRWRRPVWWQELAIIAVCYWLYTMGRNAVPEQASIALRHGRSVQHLQDLLHLNFELSVNEFVARNEWIAQPMDYYYATLHFVVTIGVLVWLFVKRPHVYRGARTVLAATSLLGLVGFFVYPLAPPRLLGKQFHYVDTLAKFHTWGSLADPKIAEHSNQYAAMPSLHIAWALWCGIAVFVCAKPLAVRIVGLLYPLGTLVVIIGTANHFIIDAVAGALIVAMGFGIQWLMSGHGAYQPPVDAPDFGMPDPPLPSLPHSSHGT